MFAMLIFKISEMANCKIGGKNSSTSFSINFFRFHPVVASIALIFGAFSPMGWFCCIRKFLFRCPMTGSIAALRPNFFLFFLFR